MKVFLFLLIGAVAIIVGGFFYLGQKSQSGEAPGLVNGALAPCPDKPNCENSEGWNVADENVKPYSPEVWESIPAVVPSLGGKIITNTDNYIAAEFTSSVFRFIDDVEFRKAEDAVHIRSASRVGHSDMGANRKRVEALRSALAE